jgi:hypothetical protein
LVVERLPSTCKALDSITSIKKFIRNVIILIDYRILRVLEEACGSEKF